MWHISNKYICIYIRVCMYVSLYDVFKYISYNWYMGALYHHIYRETGVFRTTDTYTLSCIISLIVYKPSQPWLIAEETLHLAELNNTNEAYYIGVSYICCICIPAISVYRWRYDDVLNIYTRSYMQEHHHHSKYKHDARMAER